MTKSLSILSNALAMALQLSMFSPRLRQKREVKRHNEQLEAETGYS